MFKKITAGICVFALLFTLSACSLNKNGGGATAETTTVKETRIHNYFKDALPEFDFKNEPSEEYNEGISYVLRVNASNKEVAKYIKKLKSAGFDQNVTEAENYYAAKNADGYSLELTYIDDILTLHIKKV